MTQFIEGLDRQQTMLLPECLDDYVDENSPVRAIDAFADQTYLILRCWASMRCQRQLDGLAIILACCFGFISTGI